MRVGLAFVGGACFAALSGVAHAEYAAISTDRCIDACIATQRTCVIKAVTVADKSKCTKDNATCSTACPLPNRSAKPPK